LVGDAIEEAAEALVRGVASFFPQRRRAALERLWTRLTQARAETLTMATNKLNSPLLEQALQTQIQQLADQIDRRLSEFGSTSGNSPASSASTPAD
jgi:acyl-CoA reductase-like NAD-dependent aldehyde dehydrogenase